MPEFKIPKTMGACADLLYSLREDRLALEKEADAISKNESLLRDHIINSLPKDDSTGTRGKIAQVTISTKVKPSPRDWSLIWKFIIKNKAYDLLQHRCNEAAVAARWEEGIEIPGMDKYNAVTVSCTKLGSK
jgi:hypothetical protein